MIYKIICIGKIKNSNLKSEIEELKKRIARLEIQELKEIKEKTENEVKNKEYEEIKKHLNNSYLNILLTENGTSYTTQTFHQFLKKQENPICFIISGAFGPDEKLKQEINQHLSLSKMTFTHEMAQYLLIEQLYRAECIEKNIPYTK